MWEPELVVAIDSVDPDGLGALKSPWVLWGLWLLGAWGRALGPLGPHSVGPIADPCGWVEVEVAA